jgi:hypothetical protein
MRNLRFLVRSFLHQGVQSKLQAITNSQQMKLVIIWDAIKRKNIKNGPILTSPLAKSALRGGPVYVTGDGHVSLRVKR